MATFRLVYPDGYEDIIENTEYIYGRKHQGERPVELHITGDMPNKYGRGEGSFDWQFPVLHPVVGVMTHNGEVVRVRGGRVVNGE
jgi:hypothetical protein